MRIIKVIFKTKQPEERRVDKVKNLVLLTRCKKIGLILHPELKTALNQDFLASSDMIGHQNDRWELIRQYKSTQSRSGKLNKRN